MHEQKQFINTLNVYYDFAFVKKTQLFSPKISLLCTGRDVFYVSHSSHARKGKRVVRQTKKTAPPTPTNIKYNLCRNTIGTEFYDANGD